MYLYVKKKDQELAHASVNGRMQRMRICLTLSVIVFRARSEHRKRKGIDGVGVGSRG